MGGRDKILSAAYDLAVENGLEGLSRCAVARKARMAESSVGYHFGALKYLRREVLRLAIIRGNVPLIAQGMAARDQIIMDGATQQQRRDVSEYIGNYE